MLAKITRRKDVTVDQSLQQLSKKLQQILATRGISHLQELDYSLTGLLPPTELKNIQVATEALFKAVEQQQSILIIGDFDADGATSTAVMMKALKSMGVKNVNFLVPDRFIFGYGLSVKLVEQAAKLKPDLIVTVDNGISNVDGVARANQLNIDVIITDHHLAGEVLPQALAIINPNQPGDTFKSKNLAGVGVAFYLMLSLRAHMRSVGWFKKHSIEEPNLAELLDLVALGTVADVVPLDRNNRILVEQGLKRIRRGLACAGIKALLQVAKRQENQCQASDLGFAIGPRINAAGRLDDMSVGINCLLAEDSQMALSIATQLDNFNRSRRNIEQSMLEQATLDLEAYLEKERTHQLEKQRPSALCFYDSQWHQGVIGILASRLKEKINRPVIVFTLDESAEDKNVESSKAIKNTQTMIKGSARSVKGIHIRDILADINTLHPALIEKFGGHAMAAGLSMKLIHFNKFAELFYDAVESCSDFIKDEVITDGELSAEEMTLDFATQLRRYGPWGQGFLEPLFDDEFTIVNCRLLAEEHLKFLIEKPDAKEKQTSLLDAIYFRCPKDLLEKADLFGQSIKKVRIVYKLTINDYRGKQTPQLIIEQLETI